MPLLSTGTRAALAGFSWQFYAALAGAVVAAASLAVAYHLWVKSDLQEQLTDAKSNLATCNLNVGTLETSIANQNAAIEALAADATVIEAKADAAAAETLRRADAHRAAVTARPVADPADMNRFFEEEF